MIRNGRFIMVDWRAFAAGCALVALAGGALGVWGVGRAHEARRLHQEVCAERVHALLTASAFLRDIVLPDDPCLALEVATR